jgi:hypothetical protein
MAITVLATGRKALPHGQPYARQELGPAARRLGGTVDWPANIEQRYVPRPGPS